MKKTILVATTVLTALMGLNIAQAGDIKAPTEAKMKVTNVTLAIKSPAANVCPSQGKMKAWIKTNKPGQVSYFFARQGQNPSPIKVVNAVKMGGNYMVELEQNLSIHHAIDTKYRLFAKGANGQYAKSMWVPLKANCTIGLGGNVEFKS